MQDIAKAVLHSMCTNKRIAIPENEIASHVNDNIVYDGNEVNNGKETKQKLKRSFIEY